MRGRTMLALRAVIELILLHLFLNKQIVGAVSLAASFRNNHNAFRMAMVWFREI